MASFFNGLFNRQASRSPGQSSPTAPPPPPGSAGSTMQTTTSPNAPAIPQIPASSSFSASMQSSDAAAAAAAAASYGGDGRSQQQQQPLPTRRVPFFFREENSNLVVKGNFMTLAAKPEHLDLGEWLAHQLVEQYRLLEGWIKIVQETDQKTGLPVCNQNSCPTMSASEYIYTWLDSRQNPTRIPAAMYMSRVQKWIVGKITDQKLFPTDTTESTLTAYPNPSLANSGTNTPIAAGPTNLNMSLSALSGKDWLGKSAGFPENFEAEVKHLYRQMFRCYAHLYHSHWLDPFYHIGVHKELNTCFIHFVNVGRLFDLISDRDLAPMQPLVDIWLAKGLLPSLKPAGAAAAPSSAGGTASGAGDATAGSSTAATSSTLTAGPAPSTAVAAAHAAAATAPVSNPASVGLPSMSGATGTTSATMPSSTTGTGPPQI